MADCVLRGAVVPARRRHEGRASPCRCPPDRPHARCTGRLQQRAPPVRRTAGWHAPHAAHMPCHRRRLAQDLAMRVTRPPTPRCSWCPPCWRRCCRPPSLACLLPPAPPAALSTTSCNPTGTGRFCLWPLTHIRMHFNSHTGIHRNRKEIQWQYTRYLPERDAGVYGCAVAAATGLAPPAGVPPPRCAAAPHPVAADVDVDGA